MTLYILWQDAKDADESAAEERGEAEKEVLQMGDGEKLPPSTRSIESHQAVKYLSDACPEPRHCTHMLCLAEHKPQTTLV